MCLGVSLLTKHFIKLTVDDGLQLIINSSDTLLQSFLTGKLQNLE